MQSGSVDSLAEAFEAPPTPLGLRHVPLMFTTPGEVFRRVEDTGAYGWALALLLLLVSAIGYLQIQSGLVDRIVQASTARQMARLEEDQLHLVDRRRFDEAMERLREAGQFNLRLRRLHAVALAPLGWLVALMFIAAVLYSVVALCGRKPEYHTLLSICVHAAYIQLAGAILLVVMMLVYRTSEVDTSLAMIVDPRVHPTAAALLAATDPFRVWFWVLVAMGLIVTRQLSRRMAIVSCVLLAAIGMAVDVGLALASTEMGT